jgi:hypothetical protein
MIDDADTVREASAWLADYAENGVQNVEEHGGIVHGDVDEKRAELLAALDRLVAERDEWKQAASGRTVSCSNCETLVAERDAPREEPGEFSQDCAQRDEARKLAAEWQDQAAKFAAMLEAVEDERDDFKRVYMEQRGMREEADMRLVEAEAVNARLREDLATTRAAWDSHMATCPPPHDLPTPEDIDRWRNAPSNTASGAALAAGDKKCDYCDEGLPLDSEGWHLRVDPDDYEPTQRIPCNRKKYNE